MSKPTKSEHMSKFKFKSDNLHPLQKLIVLNLAENEPRTINQTVRALSKSYKPAWIAFHSLEKKKLIRKTDVKRYRGREYPRFWLTDEGMIMAMLEGVNPAILLDETKKLFPDRKMVHCFLELVPYMNQIVLRLAYSSVKGGGKLEFKDMATIIISQAGIPMEVENLEKFVAVFRKYPEEYQKLRRLIQIVIDQLKRLKSD